MSWRSIENGVLTCTIEDTLCSTGMKPTELISSYFEKKGNQFYTDMCAKGDLQDQKMAPGVIEIRKGLLYQAMIESYHIQKVSYFINNKMKIYLAMGFSILILLDCFVFLKVFFILL